MRKVTIKRSEWIHTKEDLMCQSVLHRLSDGKKCCLGFYAVACGIPVAAITSVASFYKGETCRFKGSLPDEMLWLVDDADNRNAAKQLMSDNDSTYLTEPTKENDIAKTFAKHGVKVTFVD